MKEFERLMNLSKQSGLVKSYEMSADTSLVIFVSNVWYSQEVGFKKESPFSSGVVTAVVKKSEGETLLLSVILKTDVSGSLEVISEIIKAFPGVKIFRGCWSLFGIAEILPSESF